MKVAIITANTNVYKGLEENDCGIVIQDTLVKAGHEVVFMKPVPCDKKVLTTVMQRIADSNIADLILTTGGAGCAKGDCTPEATMELLDRVVPGIPEALRTYTFQLTKRAMLNRGVAGFKGDVMIVNLPGKVNAVKACLDYILAEVTHAVSIAK